MKAVWNGATLPESDRTLQVEGNHYFPAESINRDYLRASIMRSVCPWKGGARYYTLEVDGVRNVNDAWSYPQPFPWIRKIKGHVAFWNSVEVGPVDIRPHAAAVRSRRLSQAVSIRCPGSSP